MIFSDTKLNFIISVLQQMHPYDELNGDTELVESGLLDSLSILLVISQLEENFDIVIDEKFIDPKYFSTPQNIAKLVEQLSS